MKIIFSPDFGLRLILTEVVEDSPAWRHGLRPGNTIIAVNGWTITLMDKPEVNLTLKRRKNADFVFILLGGSSSIPSLL